jgi:hypothetical protein
VLGIDSLVYLHYPILLKRAPKDVYQVATKT